jgi:hypothetical protein
MLLTACSTLDSMQSAAQWHANTCKLCMQPMQLAVRHQCFLPPMLQAACRTPQIYFHETNKIATWILCLCSLWAPRTFPGRNNPERNLPELGLA